MSVWVLGPLLTDGGPLSPRERSVLSALVLRAGFAVTPDELADAVWGDVPPGTWPKQLQASIGLVRRSVGARTIATGSGGYTINLDPDSVDAFRFDRLVDAARAHTGNDDPARAADALDRALDLWRGAPYPDLQSWPPAVVESQRLTEVRVEAEELRLGVRLVLGEHDSAVAGAERLVREQPLREQRWVLLATALYRSGRQADALAAIRSARERLAEELGIEPGEDLRRLELAILRHDSDLELRDPPATPSDVCPYRGLTPFGVDDEDDFFGRDDDIDAALGRLARSPFLAVTGASGSGKSSLVRAGLVPVLRRRGDRVVVLTPSSGLGTAIRDAISEHREAQVVLVDQFEELFHAGVGAPEVDDAGRAVADAIEHGASVILVVRSDFLDECAAQPDLGRLFAQGVHLVGPMAPESLRHAIEQPARRAGLRLEPGLTELILRDATGGTGSLPHVSHALVETWLRREGGTLTVSGYEASGGISGAIAQSADRLYQSLDTSQRALCRSTLARLVALAPDGSPVRRRVPSRALRADAARDEVLSLLADARLVSTEADSVGVAHESLAIAWPRLHGWLEEDAESSRLLTTLSNAADAWEADGRSDEDLYRGARLQAAREWRDAAPRDLTGTESDFLAASSSHETSEQEALAERARHDRRQNRRLRSILAVAAGLIVLLVGAGTFAAVSADQAQRGRKSATIEALTSTALALRGSEPEVAALLAAESYRRWPADPRAQAALLGVLTAARGFLGNSFVEGTVILNGVVIPGTDHAFVVEGDGDAVIRDIETAAVVSEIELDLTDTGGPFPLVSVSADGRVGAVLWSAASEPPESGWYTASVRSHLVVVDLTSGERLLGPSLLAIGTGAVAVDDDGSTVAVADGLEGGVTLVDVASGDLTPVAGESTALIENETYAAALAFAHDGRLLAGHLGDRLDVVEPDSASVVAHIEVPPESAHVSMQVLPSGIVVASGDRAMIALDPARGTVLWAQPLTGSRPAGCEWIAASELNGRIYCSGEVGGVIEYDLRTGELTGLAFDGVLGGTPIGMTAEEATELVAISTRKGSISRWKLDGSGLVTRLIAPPGSVLAGGFAQGGRAILTGQLEGPLGSEVTMDVAMRDAVTGDEIASHHGPMADVAWAGNARILAYFPNDRALRILDMSTGENIGPPLPGDATFGWVTHHGTRLYIPMEKDRVVPIDTATGRIDGEPITTEGDVFSLSASPDGKRLAITSLAPDFSFILSIVDSTTNEVLRSGRLENGLGFHALLDDGSLIAAGDNRIARFDTTTFRQSGSLPGTAGGLGALTLSEDGRVVLITAADGSVMLYDVATGIRLADSFRPDGGKHLGAALRSDGLELAVSLDSGVFIWDLDPAHHLDAVCRLAGRDLTPDEWRSLLPDDLGEPQSTCGFS